MTKLNTTREMRDDIILGWETDFVPCHEPEDYPQAFVDTLKDCNTLEDELARVREELESARLHIAELEKDPNDLDCSEYDSKIIAAIKRAKERFGGRE